METQRDMSLKETQQMSRALTKVREESEQWERCANRKDRELEDMCTMYAELKKVDEAHRKLNGELRQELDDAWDCINKMRATYIELDAAYNMFLNTETQLRFNITHREEDN